MALVVVKDNKLTRKNHPSTVCYTGLSVFNSLSGVFEGDGV
jgi:hypothetical protein